MDKGSGGFPRISTIFDQANDSLQGLLCSGSIHKVLTRLLPPSLLFSEATGSEFKEEFLRLLPLIKWYEWGESQKNLSIFLLCLQRVNGVKFFYEMISRWLIPGKRPNISSFFATDFKMPEITQESFTVSEIIISFDSPSELERVRHQLTGLKGEISVGLLSVYHANRLLEIKGLSADEKTALIQERIVSLLEKRPHDFDHDIFTQMQHFLIMCNDEFKAIHEYAHMSRIIYVFYLFTKALRDQIEKHPGQRFVQVKLTKTYLHLPLRVKKVVGVFIALNFLSHSELFEERHCVGVLRNRFPELSLIQGSFFSRNSKEELVQLLYFEVEKEDGSGFSLSEVKNLKERLPDEVRNGIEKLTRPVFMPRNEEEVMRNIITLSNQLKFFRDLPQVIITFDEQAETQLSFTVVLVRALKPADLPVQQLFESAHSFAKFSLDRVKKVGMLRNKYPKEATVCRLRFDAHPFLRPDHSVDLFKARQSLVQELVRVLGDFRDYNGGMIAKQHEQYIALKKLLQGIDSKEELLLENFFHSIFPVEMRSLFNPIPLRNLFSFVREKIQENKEAERKTEFSYQADEHHLYFVLSYEQTEIKDAAVEAIQAMQIPSSQLLTVSMRAFETGYFAFIYKDDQPDNREKFLKQICPCLESLTFEPQTSYH